MLLPSSQEYSKKAERAVSVLDALVPEVIGDHVHDLLSLDGPALRDTLVPHRVLPTYDPAGYLIAYRDLITPKSFRHYSPTAIDEQDGIGLKSSYDLGVVFGSSLVFKAQRLTGSLPLVISEELNPNKKKLIETYLHRSDELSVRRLTGNDPRTNHALSEGLKRFIDHSKKVIPELTSGDKDELRRGCHDYLSIVALLEASEADQRRLLKRSLGKVGLLSLLHIKR